MSKLYYFAAGLLIVIFSVSVFAIPKPSPVPVSWQLDIKFQDIKRIHVNIPGEGEKTFWYMIYTITNNTGQDVVFHPEFELVTNTLQVIPAEINVAPEVFKAIKEKYKATYPWLENPLKIIGKILQGKDNARDSVAIWPDFDPKASRFDIYIGGLSGEVAAVPNPLFIKGKSDPKKVPPYFVLQKTMVIHYSVPSDPANREKVGASRTGQPDIEWVMR